MVGIRTKMVLFIFVLLSLAAAIGIYSMRSTINFVFGNLERQLFLADAIRIENGFLDSLNQIQSKALDWAVWDDSYHFMEKQNETYLSAIDAPSNWVAIRINSVVYLDRNFNPYYTYGVDLDQGIRKSIDPLFMQALERYLKSRQPLLEKDFKGLTGLLAESGQLFAISILPINLVDYSQASNGFLVWGRQFSAVEQEIFAKTVNYPVQMVLMKDSDPSSLRESDRVAKGIFLDFSRDDSIHITHIFRDLFDRPILALHTEMPRQIHQLGKKMLSDIVVLIALGVSLTLIALIIVGDRFVVAPLSLIARQASRINSLNPDSRINISRKDEFGALARAMNQMLDTLSERAEFIKKQQEQLTQRAKMASLGELSSGVAHEINNPLAIISGFAHLIERHCSEEIIKPEQIKTHAMRIQAAVDRASKIILGLQSFARQRGPNKALSIPLGSILQEVTLVCAEKLQAAGIDLTIDTAGIEPSNLYLLSHAGEVEQVLINLLSNAVDASLDAKEKWIKIEFKRQTKQLEIHVLDSGPGVPEQFVHKIFEPFFTTKEVGKGTGLGLSISKGLIESNGGQLYYVPNSKPTCFVIEMPLTNFQ
jgi:signal transduction histidine kinase